MTKECEWIVPFAGVVVWYLQENSILFDPSLFDSEWSIAGIRRFQFDSDRVSTEIDLLRCSRLLDALNPAVSRWIPTDTNPKQQWCIWNHVWYRYAPTARWIHLLFITAGLCPTINDVNGSLFLSIGDATLNIDVRIGLRRERDEWWRSLLR